jgi:RimJ/RimL family protein N-acetyltransferase
MTDAVETLLWQWAVPRMGVRRVLVSVFGGNHGSTRVFQKNGFVVTNTLKNYAEVRGKMRDFVVLEWDFDTVEKQVGSQYSTEWTGGDTLHIEERQSCG